MALKEYGWKKGLLKLGWITNILGGKNVLLFVAQ
jgi:hypothetical protein